MENNEIVKAISHVITYHPAILAQMLTNNGVVVDASNFTYKQLSDATVSGLVTSKKFNNDFINYVKTLKMELNFYGMDGYSNAAGDWASAISSGIGVLGTWGMANTNTKNLQAQLDAQNATNQTQLQLAQTQLQIAQVNANSGLNQSSAGKSGNTTLYIALGIGGALVLGIVIFLVVRKK